MPGGLCKLLDEGTEFSEILKVFLKSVSSNIENINPFYLLSWVGISSMFECSATSRISLSLISWKWNICLFVLYASHSSKRLRHLKSSTQTMKTLIRLPIASYHKLGSLRQQKCVLSQFLDCMHRNTRVYRKKNNPLPKSVLVRGPASLFSMEKEEKTRNGGGRKTRRAG